MDQVTQGHGRAVAGAGGSAALGYAAASPDPMLSRPAAVQDGWRLWGAGFGNTERLRGNTQVGSASLRDQTAGGSLGADYRITADAMIGFGVGASSSSFSVPDRSTSGQLDGGHIGVYGVMWWADLYAAGALTYTRFDNHTTRTINAFDMTETAKGSFGSNVFDGRFEIGRKMGLDTFSVTPFAAIQFAELWQAGYAETSTGGTPGVLGLRYQPTAAVSLPTFLGAQVDSRWVYDNGMFVAAFVRAAWVHEFDPTRRITAALMTVPMPTFTVDGARAAGDSLRLDIGGRLGINQFASLYVRATGEFSDAGQSYSATGGIRVAW
jgi:outer membrane autotransporter protein